MSLSWDVILKRAKENNKTVISEVEKRKTIRYFNIRCNKCNFKKESPAHLFYKKCVICFNCDGKDKELLKKKFIIKAKQIHGDKYNYNLVEYINSKTKVKIFCNQCKNTFLQVPRDHLDCCGCKICGIKKSCLSNEEFIARSIKVHNRKYNYDLVQYINSKTKVNIKCNHCENKFLQTPNDHLKGYGCKICANNNLKSNKEEFIIKAKKIHGEKYNYDFVDYIKSSSKINIKCNKCENIFSTTPNGHLKTGSKCTICYNFKKLSTEEWILKVKKVHGYRFNYDLVNYVNNETKVYIKCNKCERVFFQTPYHHADGKGCPFCTESKGEIRIEKYLNINNKFFSREHIFDRLKYILPLRFDFYLHNLNLLIEYDGEGHYKAIFGSTIEEKQKNLEDCKKRDKIKDDWTKINNIPLLRIPYWDFDRIEELIEEFILENTKKQDKQVSLEI